MINHALGELEDARRINLVVFSAMTILGFVLSFTEPYWGLVALTGVVKLVQTPWLVKRLRERKALLAG